MRLDTRAFGLAAWITAAVLYSICALLVAVNPGGATALFGFVMHMDLTGVARPVTFAGYLGGVVFWGVLVGLTFGLAAWLYNRLAHAPAAVRAPLREPGLARG